MESGSLRHPVTLQKYTQSRNDWGEVIEDWADIGVIWANVRGISGKEFIAAQAAQSETLYRVTVRYRPDLDSQNRFKLQDGRILEITAVLPDNTTKTMLCMCSYMPGRP